MGSASASCSAGLDLSAATHTYSILSIGEGLVAQIPALLGAMAAGLMVTRSSDEETDANMGQAIHRQLSSNPRVLLFAGATAFLMALVPGFPVAVFLMLGFGLTFAGATIHPRLQPYVLKHSGPLRKMIARGKEPERPVTLLAEPASPKPVVPLLLQVSGPRPSAEDETALTQGLTTMLDRVQHRSGVPLPKLAIHFLGGDARSAWRLLAFELPVGVGEGSDAATVVAGVEGLIRRSLARFLGVQEAVALLNRVGEAYPEVVKEAVRAVPTARLADVLRRLAEEEVPLRNMRDVLEGLTEAAGQERETNRIADMTRIALKHYLLDGVAREGLIRALVVAPELEVMLTEAMRAVEGSDRLALQPEIARDLVGTVASLAAETRANAIVTGFDVRRALRKLIEPDLFDLPVLAFNEMSPTARVEIVGQIAAPHPALTDATGHDAARHSGHDAAHRGAVPQLQQEQ